IENACRSISLKKGGFFNDTNPRGSNLCLRDPEGFDIQKKDPTTRQIYEENIKQLNDLAGKCSSENIRFIIVVPPFGKCKDDGKRKELRAELLDVLDELPYPVEYQDLNSEIWEGIFFEEDFYNYELLNESGARKFSQILNELTSMDQV
ncbi:MAG: hypothetical protein K5929_07985, partial [Lachnospiraceae bacterium]|nr:hypothetical protein [Lachnospiraceae bacterium]